MGDVFSIKNIQLFDLTDLFGAGNEPTTFEDFVAVYPRIPYGLTEGFKSTSITGIRTIGFNAFDIDSAEDMGNIDYSYDEPRAFKEKTVIVGISRNNVINKSHVTNWSNINGTIKCSGIVNYGLGHPIRVIPNKQYQLTGNIVTGHLSIGWFDNNGNLISHTELISENIDTSPSNAYWALVCCMNDNNGLCEISNICFHLVHSGYKNGTYESY